MVSFPLFLHKNKLNCVCRCVVSASSSQQNMHKFWATTYDMHLHSHYSCIGFIDEKGQLYFHLADPEEEIPANSSTFVQCTVSAQ